MCRHLNLEPGSFDVNLKVALREVVLFGGYAYSYLGDTWAWDGATWTQR